MPPVSHRLQSVPTPVIPVIGELIRRFPGTISLGQGVVFYPPPQEAVDAIDTFLKEPANHKYQLVQGIPEFLAAIREKLAQDNAIHLRTGQDLCVTAGANMGFLNALLAIADPGDEIILPSPYYFNHQMAVTMANCRPVPVPTTPLFQLDLARIEAAISPASRAIVTISPNNPSGAVYPREDLQAIQNLCLSRGLYHIHDEAYEYFLYNQAQHYSPAQNPTGSDCSISLFSLSKSYGFASWRIGYMIAPAHLMPAIKKIQDTNLICPPVISQHAAVGALRAGKAYCQQHLPEIAASRQLLLRELGSIPGVEVPPVTGAFYLLVRLPLRRTAMDAIEYLVSRHQVAAIPGDAFGIDDGCWLRIAYGALRQETALQGIERLIRGIKNLLKTASGTS